MKTTHNSLSILVLTCASFMAVNSVGAASGRFEEAKRQELVAQHAVELTAEQAAHASTRGDLDTRTAERDAAVATGVAAEGTLSTTQSTLAQTQQQAAALAAERDAVRGALGEVQTTLVAAMPDTPPPSPRRGVAALVADRAAVIADLGTVRGTLATEAAARVTAEAALADTRGALGTAEAATAAANAATAAQAARVQVLEAQLDLLRDLMAGRIRPEGVAAAPAPTPALGGLSDPTPRPGRAAALVSSTNPGEGDEFDPVEGAPQPAGGPGVAAPTSVGAGLRVPAPAPAPEAEDDRAGGIPAGGRGGSTREDARIGTGGEDTDDEDAYKSDGKSAQASTTAPAPAAGGTEDGVDDADKKLETELLMAQAAQLASLEHTATGVAAPVPAPAPSAAAEKPDGDDSHG